MASYAGLIGQPGQAEVAFAVADHMHHKGIATLLLEHLVSLARSRQITTFTAETLTENTAMLKVFADAGLPVQRRFEGEVYELTFPLPRARTAPRWTPTSAPWPNGRAARTWPASGTSSRLSRSWWSAPAAAGRRSAG